ncbi:hypothetical protein Aab01nite_74730 [Paractinoplanes abujensis]|uniref:ABC-type cobalamin/Fe3+-siderophores transport system ATPase subunit n=1 Tax=Paractinoplanes abujensis TaxID=882441 RepID=A0A7W7CVF5_9ACTN|nr:ABC-type cobalamin/Fe3+-siderophores transport system ATPase subunit [Actinoplanes abujensis]GID23883.1 hypothetical protein Aab01nite_74730 [Actinoplanes abujensis]
MTAVVAAPSAGPQQKRAKRRWTGFVAALAAWRRPSRRLLDEPTTFLDLSHQFEVLDLCAELHEQGRTIVAVLHDLNHAGRYATDLIVMKDGRVNAQGAPAEVMTARLVEDVFAMPCRTIDDPETETPMVVPADRHRRRTARTAGVRA